jgi:Ni,Fe-hydrogenase III component G
MKKNIKYIKKPNIYYINERIRYINSKEVKEFIRLFIICEYFYKTLVKLNHQYSNKNEIKIHLTTVKSVFKEIGYEKTEILKVIFGSQKDSYKQLRNSIVHSISRNSSKKVIQQNNLYLTIMKDFIQEIIQLSK